MKKTSKKKIKESIILVGNADGEQRKALIEVAMAALGAGRLAINAERAKLNALGILEVPKDEKKLFDGSLARKYKKARDAATTAEELERLSKDDDEVVRYMVAGNDKTAKKTLERLSRDRDKFVKSTALDRLKTLLKKE